MVKEFLVGLLVAIYSGVVVASPRCSGTATRGSAC